MRDASAWISQCLARPWNQASDILSRGPVMTVSIDRVSASCTSWMETRAHLDIEIVVDFDNLPKYTDPLVEICEEERISQLVDQRVLFRLLRLWLGGKVGLAVRPLSSS